MTALLSPWTTNSLLSLLTCCLTFLCLKTIYRLLFHPLRKFPGPKIVAVSRCYEYYWEVYRSGRFSQQIDRMHDRYGPIVRIGPNEIHVNDPSFYDFLYNFDTSIDRPKVNLDNLQHSASFDLHKMRRRVFEPYFSKQAVFRLEASIRSNVEKLSERLAESRKPRKSISVSLLGRCFTADVISEYVFAQSYGFLDNPKESEIFFGSYTYLFKNFFLYREFYPFYWLSNAMGTLPEWMLPKDGVADAMGPFIMVSDSTSGSSRLLVARLDPIEPH